jgi:N utilization substance protein A
MSPEDAEALIMRARVVMGWIEAPPEPEAEPEAEAEEAEVEAVAEEGEEA